MARQIKYEDANTLLDEIFPLAEDDFRDSVEVTVPEKIVESTERLFKSETQAYREALIGCAVARILDPEIDVRLPATEHGESAFSGRTLADRVITPFMRNHSVPISASPYLSSLRGGARFVKGGEPRIQRDKYGFLALVDVVDYLQKSNANDAQAYLRYLLRRFVQLRESANIALKKIAKPNLEQLDRLIGGLLTVKSGGRIPSFLAVAMFQTLSECHDLKWDVEFQGINVADKFTGAVGDITIRKGGQIILGVEVTERPVGAARVRLIFEQKISPSGLADYLVVTTAKPEDEALAVARSYTAVGHEMNFVPLAIWLSSNLSVLGPACRAIFQTKMLELIGGEGVPAEIKVAWNDTMDAAIGIKH